MNVSCKKKTSIERNCEISEDFRLLSVNILNCPQHSLLVLCDVTHRAVQEHKKNVFIWVEVAQCFGLKFCKLERNNAPL